jgi:hypothetical protein
MRSHPPTRAAKKARIYTGGNKWLNELPAACRNVATHEVALLNSHLRNAGQQTAVLRNGASVPDDEYSAEIWWFRTWADTDPACMIRLEWK